MKKLNNKKLIELVEGMCLLHDEGDTNNIQRTNDIISKIYRYVHSNSGHCRNPHIEWRKESIEMYKSLKGSLI